MKHINFQHLVFNDFDFCPYCHSKEIIKHGHQHKHQRYICKHCHKTFSTRNNTILFSSKLSDNKLKSLISMLIDGIGMHQIKHQLDISIPTIILWKRKLQQLVKNSDDIVLSDDIYVDETYIDVSLKDKSKEHKRGLSHNKLQIIVAIDSNNKVFAKVNRTGLPRSIDIKNCISDHIKDGSIIYHDGGHYKNCFTDCKEVIIKSKSNESFKILNPINTLCSRIKRYLMVHIRIHKQNLQKWLDEFVEKINLAKNNFKDYLRIMKNRIFTSNIKHIRATRRI